MNSNRSFNFRKPAGGKTAGDEFALSAQMMNSRTWLLIDRARLLLNLPQPKIRRPARSTMRQDSTLLRRFSNQL
jgi:hypothetical protein